MPILGAFMVPHPPIMLPEVGRGEEKKISDVTEAYEKVADTFPNGTDAAFSVCLWWAGGRVQGCESVLENGGFGGDLAESGLRHPIYLPSAPDGRRAGQPHVSGDSGTRYGHSLPCPESERPVP